MTDKRETEIAIFRDFASEAKLELEPGTEESRDPPEPDILCRISGEIRAFELTEVVDPIRKRSRAVMLEAIQEFQKIISNLPPQHPLNKDFSDAGIQVTFRDDATESACKKAGEALIDHLAVPQSILNIAGREFVRIPATQPLNAIRFVNITRGYPNGPVISAASGGPVDIPVIGAVAAKFAKSYSTSVTIDLLAYFDSYRSLDEVRWLPKLEAFVEAEKGKSQFDRVWVYDRRGHRLVYPPWTTEYI